MSRLTPTQGLLMNLAQKIDPEWRAYLPREQAYEQLKKLTGQDFGYDVNRWRQWLKEHPLFPETK